MPTLDQIKALLDKLPELDNPPPAPEKKPEPDKKPAGDKKPDAGKPADGDKKPAPAGDPKATDPKAADSKPAAPPKPSPDKGKLTGPAWGTIKPILDSLLAGGSESIMLLIDLIKEPDLGPAYKPRYVLNGLAVYVARPENRKGAADLQTALLTRLGTLQSPALRGLMIRTLQSFAGSGAIAAMVPLLTDPTLCDPAAQALVSFIKSDLVPSAVGNADIAPALTALRDTLTSTTGRPRLAAAQALGYLKHTAAIEPLAKLAADPATDDSLRSVALWSLAQTAAPQAVDPILKAIETAPEGWPRNQAIKAAFALAENLAAAQQSDAAKKIYRTIYDTRTAATEAHFRSAAENALGH